MNAKSPGHGGQLGRQGTTRMKTTETQPGSQLLYQEAGHPTQALQDAGFHLWLVIQRGQSSSSSNDCSLPLPFLLLSSQTSLGCTSSLPRGGVWMIETLTGSQTVIGIRPSSSLCWQSLCQSKGNHVGLFVIDGKFFLPRLADPSISTRCACSWPPFLPRAHRSLSFFFPSIRNTQIDNRKKTW